MKKSLPEQSQTTDATQLDPIVVTGQKRAASNALTSSEASQSDLDTLRLSTSDTARLLSRMPGISLQTAGGVSALPVLNGLAADRVKTLVNGMDIAASCGNFMNPPLSYIDPAAVKSVSLHAGVTPVSLGGDSIAGTISVKSADPVFAEAGQGVVRGGRISTFYRSNGNSVGGSARVYVATEDLNLTYTGSSIRSQNYTDGAGNTVKSSLVSARNHAVNLAARRENHLFGLEASWQDIPYQGFVNQRMDMTDNEGVSVNAKYEGDFDWGTFEARAYRHNVRHTMNMLADKLPNQMPMETSGNDTGATILADITALEDNRLRLGAEYHRYRLDDWWPPLAGSMMMGPGTFWNINNGQRDRLAVFSEVETDWTPQWQTNIGARYERVLMNTGDVKRYSGFDSEALAFNALDRKRTDDNIDLTATARYSPDASYTFELGAARKTRAPNLYERYAWSSWAMAAAMVNWFGDLNGYVGNVNLKPEVANTLSASFEWHDAQEMDWHIKTTAYYTRVEDYINVERIGAVNNGKRAKLKFVNHDAELYGINLEASKRLGEFYGDWQLKTTFNYGIGRDLETSGNLYNIMPPNALFALEHKQGNWTNALEVQAVAAKNRVDDVRLEERTPAYALLNLRTGYTYRNVRLDIGIDNLLDKDYALPLGGIDAVAFRTKSAEDSRVRGPGRTFNLCLSVEF